MVVASGPIWKGLGFISSLTHKATRHVHVTLTFVCELNSVYLSSGSGRSSKPDHMTKMSTHSLSTILGTTSSLLILFITTTSTQETSLSSKPVCMFFFSERSPLNITSDAESYPPNHRHIPRPTVPASAPTGPKRAKYDRNVNTATDLGVNDRWDEDDVMLFFWGNSKAALERHGQKKRERTAYLEDWRAGVTKPRQ
jgi:hypothetical protein